MSAETFFCTKHNETQLHASGDAGKCWDDNYPKAHPLCSAGRLALATPCCCRLRWRSRFKYIWRFITNFNTIHLFTNLDAMHHLLRDFAVDISSDKQTLFTDFTHLTAVAQHVLRTAWAFTHSDFKTIVIPVVCSLEPHTFYPVANARRRSSTR